MIMTELRKPYPAPANRGEGTLTIHVIGNELVHYKPVNHLGMGDDARYQITDGPATIGDRWYARSVRSLVADDGTRWLVGYGAPCSVEWWGCSFGSCPNGHAVAWRERVGEGWENYA
jgi:hypothetical protein